MEADFDARRPPVRWMLAHPARILAFGLGSGLIYPAPGTWGTLLGWLLWVLLLQNQAIELQLAAIVAFFIIGCWAAQLSGAQLGIADHSGINIDEIVAIWLVLCFVPPEPLWQLLAFGLFRLFDILKPIPICWFDARLKNGFGVMLDDILAAGYAIIAFVMIYRLDFHG